MNKHSHSGLNRRSGFTKIFQYPSIWAVLVLLGTIGLLYNFGCDGITIPINIPIDTITQTTPTPTPVPTLTPTPSPTVTPFVNEHNAITLLSGIVNATALNVSSPQIVVSPGSTIAGSLKVNVHNAMGSNAVAPLCATPTWGDPKTSYWQIDSWVGTGNTDHTVNVSLTAPSAVGTYYIAVCMAGTYNPAQIMSGTHPAYEADWINGNKVALRPAGDFDLAITQGWIPFDWYRGNSAMADLAMTAVKIQVQASTSVGKIVFASQAQNALYVVDASGGTPVQVPLPASVPHATYPQWSADGTWITFQGGVGGSAQIYIVKPDGSGLKRITDGSGNLAGPSFSPDGTKIVYAPVYGNLFTLRLDGTEKTDLGVGDAHARWAPQGSKILYSNWGLTYASDLFTVDADTKVSTQITHHGSGEYYSYGAWSPDGTRLAVVKGNDTSKRRDIVVMNADGSNPVTITSDLAFPPDGTGGCSFPSWSSDGETIVFLTKVQTASKFEIWQMKPDGSGKAKITLDSTVEPHAPALK